MNEYGPLKRVISSPLLAAAKTLAADELMGNRYCYWAVSKRWRGVVGGGRVGGCGEGSQGLNFD